MKIVTIVGARPQFIKAAAVSMVLRATPSMVEILVHTGQHYDENMNTKFFEELEIPAPQYNLGIGSGTHGAQTGQMLQAIEKVLLKEKPDLVIVYGDTNSTLSGALAATKLLIPLAHVEAGLRSFNRRMPEEINRVVTDHISDILFAPTGIAVKNLYNEGISEDKIHLVGDVMYDIAVHYSAIAEKKSSIMERMNVRPGKYILATIHRAENTDDFIRLKAIFEGLKLVGSEIPVVLPLHPRTRQALKATGLLEKMDGSIRLIDPVGYLDMVMLEKNALLIATDSGGVQKEAFFCRVPCVTLRDETEWVELVELGWNRVITPDNSSSIAKGILSAFNSKGKEGSPYGDGRAAEAIVKILSDLLLKR